MTRAMAGKHPSRVWMTLLLLLLVVVSLAGFRRFSGRMLVIDQPRPGGRDPGPRRRPQRPTASAGSRLAPCRLRQTVLLDERQDTVQFGRTQAEAAKECV